MNNYILARRSTNAPSPMTKQSPFSLMWSIDACWMFAALPSPNMCPTQIEIDVMDVSDPNALPIVMFHFIYSIFLGLLSAFNWCCPMIDIWFSLKKSICQSHRKCDFQSVRSWRGTENHQRILRVVGVECSSALFFPCNARKSHPHGRAIDYGKVTQKTRGKKRDKRWVRSGEKEIFWTCIRWFFWTCSRKKI